MTEGWHPVAVGGLVLTHQEKWLLLISSLFEPVYSQVGYDVRAMSFDGGFALGSKEIRIVIEALSRKDHPLIESLRLRFEMPLSEHGCLVAYLLQKLGECLLGAIKIISVVHEAILMAVLSGNNDCPAWATN